MQNSFLRKQIQYWNNIANRVSDPVAVNHWVDKSDKPLNARLFREIASFICSEFLLDLKGGNILEIGCGSGLILRELKGLLRDNIWHLSGSDISEEMLRKINKEDFIFYNCDASRIPVNDGYFDLIYMHGVVQYFDNIAYLSDVLSECLRILAKGGGICLMDVPMSWYQPYMLNQGLKARLKRKGGDFVKRKIPQIYKIYQARRDSKIQVEYVNGKPIPLPYFKGFFADVDYFYKFGKYFKKVSVEIQPFVYKPVNYRKFRFNVLMKERNEVIFNKGDL